MSDLLHRAPHQFDFFQAVRLLGYLARARGLPPVGDDDVPAARKSVRFRTPPSLSFPASAVASLQANGAAEATAAFELGVSFLGLTGPQGVLPYHYTRLLLDRVRARDSSFRDFLDLFHHRLVELFTRAWEKYRLPFTFEHVQLASEGRKLDPVTQLLSCLAGYGTDGLRGRLEVADGAFVYYGGHFAHYPHSALALEAMLAEYFELPVEVQQFQGQWLYLEPEDCSRMPGLGLPDGQNCQLGVSLMAGARVWDIQSRVRLRLGPLDYAQFRRLLPNGDMLRPLAQMSRAYVGPELDFDVQLVLKPEEVPWCQLGEDSLLGWNTWVRCEAFRKDVDDTVFLVEDGTGLV